MQRNRLRTHAGTDELLRALADAERAFTTRGGLERQRSRNELFALVVTAGCAVEEVAEAMGVTAADIGSWMPSLEDRLS
jgi:hypothetical protein